MREDDISEALEVVGQMRIRRPNLNDIQVLVSILGSEGVGFVDVRSTLLSRICLGWMPGASHVHCQGGVKWWYSVDPTSLGLTHERIRCKLLTLTSSQITAALLGGYPLSTQAVPVRKHSAFKNAE